MENKVKVNPEVLANDYRNLNQNKLSNDVIGSGVSHLMATSTTASYPGNGSIASLIIYQKCQCTIKNGKTFNGSSWGFAVPGGGALIGDVYTDDINKLYSQTTSFAVVATPVYTTFIFKDKDGNTLGSFQAGSISTVAGSGGGSGSWS